MNPLARYMVGEVLESGYIGQGPKVDEFESKLKECLQFEYGVTVNSGTSALYLALHLIGVGPGDYIISTPMTCSATNEVIAARGADIVWTDVDKYGNMSPESLKWAINRWGRNQIKAIMVVDWGGLPCDYSTLREVANGIPIIEDAAHAFMATYKGQPLSVGGGNYICYSFQAIKNLTTGDGGLLITPAEQYERAKLLRWYGLDRTSGDAMRCRQDIPEVGFKFHMNDINATIGLANIHYASTNIVKSHRENAAKYDELVQMKLLPEWPKDRESSFWLYTIHVPHPIKFEKFMKQNGVGVSQTHNRNDRFSCFSEYRAKLPYLDKWFETMVCIPVGWWLRDEDIELIIQLVKQWIAKYNFDGGLYGF
jgi:dTDP-4-amino-4,6-dideoxygalactose transaminase